MGLNCHRDLLWDSVWRDGRLGAWSGSKLSICCQRASRIWARRKEVDGSLGTVLGGGETQRYYGPFIHGLKLIDIYVYVGKARTFKRATGVGASPLSR